MTDTKVQIKEIIKSIQGEIIHQSLKENLYAHKISIYADKITTGDIFIALNSKKYSNSDGCLGFTGNEDSVFGCGGTKDGHDDIQQAIKNGAIAIIIDDITKTTEQFDGVIILVKDSLNAICSISKLVLRKNNIKTIAITGSVGKTTTANILYKALSRNHSVLLSDHIRSTVLGLSIEIIENTNNYIEYYIIELQSDGLGQIDKLCNCLNIDYAIITEINYSHLAKFKNIENILEEKTSTYKHLSNNGKIFINCDNEQLEKWCKMHIKDKRIITTGKNPSATYFVDKNNILFKNYFDNHSNQKKIRFGKLSLTNHTIDIHNILLVLAFWETISNDSINNKIINSFLSNITTVFLRYNTFKGINNCKVIIDSYNSSYLSMKNGIQKVCNNNKKKRVILILGSMLELAEKTEFAHRELGKDISSQNNIYKTFLLGEHMLYTFFEIKKTNAYFDVTHSFSYEKIINSLLSLKLDSNTVVYIKGSGAMRMELLAPYVLTTLEE